MRTSVNFLRLKLPNYCHITSINKKQDSQLLSRFEVNPTWSYSVTPLYNKAASLSTNEVIELKDHHRCHADIIGFSNKEFYGGNLRIATNYDRLIIPSNVKPGIRWINVIGNTTRPYSGGAFNKEEIERLIIELQKLVDAGYNGSIGVVTPFRAQANELTSALEIKTELYKVLLSKNDFMAATVHKFQGDERDIMFFSTVISSGTKQGALEFLKSTGNLFNVAITRARSCLIVIGDENYCSKSGISYLEHFVPYIKVISQKEVEHIIIPDSRDYPNINVPVEISDWEKLFYTALYDQGIKTVPQYHTDKYYLDLAIFYKDKKLDIEIDGERYHRSWNGELCYLDQLRNQRLFELGWDVRRFWVYQIRDNLSWCVNQIKLWMQNC